MVRPVEPDDRYRDGGGPTAGPDPTAAGTGTGGPEDEGDRAPIDRTPTDRTPDSMAPRYFVGLVALVTLGGLLVRLPSFHDALSGDEISTYYIVHGHSLGRVLQLVHSNQETTPPLFFILAWATKGVLGSQVESIRLISLVTGTAAIPMTFVLGMWTVGRRAALVGATLVALCPFLIFFSTEARPYMLVLFFALASTLCLLRAIDTGRVGWWAGYAAASCAAAYTHYTVVFLLVAQLVWALWTSPRSRPALVIANLAAGVAYLPWLGGLREDLHAPDNVIALPVTFHQIYLIVENLWIGHTVIPIQLMPGNLALVLAVVALVLAAVGLAFRPRLSDRAVRPSRSRVVLVVLLALSPTVLIALYSWLHAPILDSRNLIASWPGLAIAMGALVTAPPRPFRVAAVVVVLVAFGIGAVKMVGASAQRPDVAAAVAFIGRAGAGNDPIVSAPYFTNPLSELDVALGNAGAPTYTPGNTADVAHPFTSTQLHPVVRLGSPPLAEQFARLSGTHPQPAFSGLPIVPPQVVARQAVAVASHGTIFLVTFATSLPLALRLLPHSPVSVFVTSLPAQYRVVRERIYPGFAGISRVAVYEFRTSGAH